MDRLIGGILPMDWLYKLMEGIHVCARLSATTAEWDEYLRWLVPGYERLSSAEEDLESDDH